MYSCGEGVLEQYGLTVKSTCRTRGAFLFETDKGWKIAKEFGGAKNKLAMQEQLQLHIRECGFEKIDCVLKNLEGELVTPDNEGVPYVVRDWYQGRECDTRSREDIQKGAVLLAKLHKVMQMPGQEAYRRESLVDECIRHTMQMRKVKRFVRKKQRKNPFEDKLLSSMDYYIAQGEAASEELKKSDYELLRQEAWEEGCICHGEYNQHNILILGEDAAAVNFEKWNFDTQMTDLYQYMRKIMEKHDWNPTVAERLLDSYQAVRPLSESELRNLKLRMAYPWKFWKLVNFYANSNKVWISGKNMEKLEQIIEQKKKHLDFLAKVF